MRTIGAYDAGQQTNFRAVATGDAARPVPELVRTTEHIAIVFFLKRINVVIGCQRFR